MLLTGVPREKHCAPTYPFCMSPEFVIGLRHGPPGGESIRHCSRGHRGRLSVSMRWRWR